MTLTHTHTLSLLLISPLHVMCPTGRLFSESPYALSLCLSLCLSLSVSLSVSLSLSPSVPLSLSSWLRLTRVLSGCQSRPKFTVVVTEQCQLSRRNETGVKMADLFGLKILLFVALYTKAASSTAVLFCHLLESGGAVQVSTAPYRDEI